MVKSKTDKVPIWLVDLAIGIMEKEIRSKAGIKISKINPSDYVKGIKIPLYCLCGNADELVT